MDQIPHNERETREQIIDRSLKLAGLDTKDPGQVTSELELTDSAVMVTAKVGFSGGNRPGLYREQGF